MSYIKREWVIEHDWKCVYCNHVNKGRDDKCSNCGKDIDEENAEIVPSDMSYENRVKDEAVAEKLSEGDPDWICAYCGHRERAEKEDCTECGSNRNEKKKDVSSGQDTTDGSIEIDPSKPIYVQKIPVVNPDGSLSVVSKVFQGEEPRPAVETEKVTIGTGFRATTIDIPKQNPFTTPSEPPAPPPSFFGGLMGGNGGGRRFINKVKRNLRTILIIAGTVTAIVGFIWLMYWLFAMHQTTARIQETHWSYSVSLFERRIYNGHDWRGEMHAHYFNAACHTEVRSHHPCQPYSCNPHRVSYDCRCHDVCHEEESCHTSCTSRGRRGSVCREVCSMHEVCHRSCDTCYRTEYDTCWHSCPDYDDMCDYQYPSWPAINHASLGGNDHTPVRPNLTATSGLTCPSDPEILYINNPNITQCTTEQVTFGVTFDAGEHGHYSVQPSTLQEYNRYRTGDNWQAQYNHAGEFRAISPIHSIQNSSRQTR